MNPSTKKTVIAASCTCGGVLLLAVLYGIFFGSSGTPTSDSPLVDAPQVDAPGTNENPAPGTETIPTEEPAEVPIMSYSDPTTETTETTETNPSQPTVDEPAIEEEPETIDPVLGSHNPGSGSYIDEIPTTEPVAAAGLGDYERLIGDIRVRLTGAKIGKTTGLGGMGLAAIKSDALIISFTFENTSTDQTIRCRSWNDMELFDMPITLEDEINTRYRQRLVGKDEEKPKLQPKVAILTDENVDAAVKNSTLPVVIHFTFRKAVLNAAMTPMIDRLSAEYIGKINVGRYFAPDHTDPNSYVETPMTTKLKEKLKLRLPCIVIFTQKGAVARWQNDPGMGAIEDVLIDNNFIPAPPPPGEDVAPGGRLVQEIAFDPVPPTGAKTLTLELPTQAVGRPGQTIKFQIPLHHIRKSQ